LAVAYGATGNVVLWLREGPFQDSEVFVEKIFTIFLYLLWTLTIIGILIVTFTNFQYEDLNLIAALLLVFTLINSYFAVSKKKK